ncbi:LytTR family transcriptional regulator DNA-binding domain-containing protein [Paenibacillus lautus]|uniref:LytTR family transcriptional regulator DNA-binding domain-containing protein n=1 Tax=Paenibacillus lautus TaxID=1401 RepID=UPI001C7D0857|nr:LytTR family transcriptional regulator DNA-binding domain-containing protein [Paenibacillus lautus]MBX4152240.1 LytTR family transcriptional regulator DNA-binding domain-containing protein [Paenibacillus lautus]
MKYIIVVRRDGKDISDKAEWLHCEDIIGSMPERIRGEIRTVYYTENGQYIHCTTNDQIIDLISKEHGFMVTDRGRMVNLKKEIIVDFENRDIFLVKCKEYITIARSKVNLLKEYLKKFSNHKKE